MGSVRGKVDGERMEVARLAIAPDMAGKGVGRKLLDAGFIRLSEWQDDLGSRLVTLEKKVT